MSAMVRFPDRLVHAGKRSARGSAAAPRYGRCDAQRHTALYGRAGWAKTKFNASVNGVTESDREDALVLGAGLKTRVGAGSLRVEYVRTDYADEVKNNRVALGYGFRF